MTTGNLLELLALLLGGGGGTAVIVRATRLVVAVEQLAEAVKGARSDIAGVVSIVQAHEAKIAHLEGQLEGQQQQPAVTAVPVVQVAPAQIPPGP